MRNSLPTRKVNFTFTAHAHMLMLLNQNKRKKWILQPECGTAVFNQQLNLIPFAPVVTLNKPVCLSTKSFLDASRFTFGYGVKSVSQKSYPFFCAIIHGMWGGILRFSIKMWASLERNQRILHKEIEIW